jgi:hypothetical protein
VRENADVAAHVALAASWRVVLGSGRPSACLPVCRARFDRFAEPSAHGLSRASASYSTSYSGGAGSTGSAGSGGAAGEFEFPSSFYPSWRAS